MSTAAEALESTFKHRDQAQSLNAVKAALANAITLTRLDDGFINAAIGLRINDLKAVVEQVETLRTGPCCPTCSAQEHDPESELNRLRSDLARVSAELGLPPTIGPAPGEIARLKQYAAELRDVEKANAMEIAALQSELATEKAAHLVTGADRDDAVMRLGELLAKTVAREDAEEHLSRMASVACGWAWDFASSLDFTERYGRTLLWAQIEDMKARVPSADQMVIRRADYERLIASLPAGPRVVR